MENSGSDTSETCIRSNVHGHIESPIHFDDEDHISSTKSVDSEAVMTAATRTTSASTCTTASPLLLSATSITSSSKSKSRSRTRFRTKTRTKSKSNSRSSTTTESPTSRQHQQQQSPSVSIPTSVVLSNNDVNLDYDDDDDNEVIMTNNKTPNSEENQVIMTNKHTIFGSSLVDSDNSYPSPTFPEQSMYHYTKLLSSSVAVTTSTPLAQQKIKQTNNHEIVIEQRNELGGRVRYGSSTKKTHSSRKRRRQTYGGRGGVAGSTSVTSSKEIRTPNLQSWEDKLYQLKPNNKITNTCTATSATQTVRSSRSNSMKSVSFHSNMKIQGMEVGKEMETHTRKGDNDDDSALDDFVFHSQSSQPYGL